VEILPVGAALSEPIGPRPFEVRLASAIALAEGEGEARATVLYLEPGGAIGPHEAGFGQLFVALAGSGWVAGADSRQLELAEGQAALIRRGEVHSKGSETGMTALMIQVRDLRRVETGSTHAARAEPAPCETGAAAGQRARARASSMISSASARLPNPRVSVLPSSRSL